MFAFLQKSKLVKSNKHFLKSTQRYTHNTGYIVLVPEIGEDTDASDALIKSDGLPAFNDITIENCLAAIGHQAAIVESTVKRIETAIIKQQGNVQTAQIFRELDEVSGPLNTTWGIAKALYLGNCTLIPTKSYMNIHERARNARASKYNCKALYEALQAKQATSMAKGKGTYDSNEERLVQKYLLEGKLNGLTLSEGQRDSLRDILSELGKERANYKNKVNMAVHTFNHTVSDFQIVRDFPPELLEATAKDPSQALEGPWKISLQPQIVSGFLKYCPDREQRWNVWLADIRKASGQLEKSLDNSVHVEKIRSLRLRQANILGYPNFVAMSLQTKMVGSVEQLKEIFAKLLQFAGPAQSVEIDELQSFASERGLKQKLDLYDIPYWQRKYLISTYNFDEQKLREYFPLPRVLDNMFGLCERLFNIKIVERQDAEVWQPAVKYYDVYDHDVEARSVPIGGFYVDCYSKENRYGKNNGWMVSVRNRNEAANLNPLCALIFNFSAPVYGKPYLLNFDDLHMIFKTFGTALQHLLTRAAFTDLAGLSNIEWDASQISANVMSNFLNDNKVLKSISGHYGNDEQITDEMAQSMQLLRTNMAGFNLCRELYFADLDIELHQSKDFWRDIVKRLWPVYNMLPFDKRDSHPCSLTDIFSGDWAAALFSHTYSRLIAADISDDFTQNSKDMPAVGRRYKSTFLESGGTIPTAEVFRRFRGRDPSEEALLKSLNIYQTSQTTSDI